VGGYTQQSTKDSRRRFLRFLFLEGNVKVSLYDIAKSGKYAHLTRIEYALQAGLDVEAEMLKATHTSKRCGEHELDAESIAIILTAKRFGKKYGYLSSMIGARHENIKPGTLRNRILEIMAMPVPKIGDELRTAMKIEMNIRKNNKSS
jgi:hypothetical protein